MADEKKKPPMPVMTSKAEGSLLALALDPSNGAAFVGGTTGELLKFDAHADAWDLELQLAGERYVAAAALVDATSAKSQLVVGRYDGSLAWYDVAANADKLNEKPVRKVAAAHRGWVRDLVAFDDGRKLASVGDDMLVKVWDARDGKLLAELAGHPTETPQGYVTALYAVAASPDGRYLASGDRAGAVFLWDVEKRCEVRRLACPELYTFDGEKRDRSFGGVRQVRFSPDGKLLAVAGIGQVTNIDGFVGPCRVEVWDWQKGKRVAVCDDEHKAVINDFVWSSDGKRLTGAGGGDAGGVLLVWDVDAATIEKAAKENIKPTLKAKFSGYTHRVAWLETDQRLLAAGFEGVQLWDLTTLA